MLSMLISGNNITVIEELLSIKINHVGNIFEITGCESILKKAKKTLIQLYKDINSSTDENFIFEEYINNIKIKNHDNIEAFINTKLKKIYSKNSNQKTFITNLRNFDINFAVGPAGTGKTYLSVARAIEALDNGTIDRIILVRPAIEAGEKLGFLPGDMEEKVSPYLRPLYDSLNEMLGPEKVNKLIENNIIEIAPLAFMRGRSLNRSYIILDEAQNTTIQQMKMFLTRIGNYSKMAIIGDITQIDLPIGVISGLVHAKKILSEISEIKFTYFQKEDVVRNKIILSIINAYECRE